MHKDRINNPYNLQGDVLSLDEYRSLHSDSITNKDSFWRERARNDLDWIKPFSLVQDTSYDKSNLHIKWFSGGYLNVSANCIDRHLNDRGDKTAILWIGDDPGVSKKVTYLELHKRVCTFANVLKKLGYKKGDRLIIYLPMIIEAAVAMLACCRLGIIHSVVFAGFSPEALSGRINDCEATGIITSDISKRGGAQIKLLTNVNDALKNEESAMLVKHVLVVQNSQDKELSLLENEADDRSTPHAIYHWYHSLADEVTAECEPVSMEANDPLFILYTSGSTGKPKGVVHGTAGYLLYASYTHRVCFNIGNNDVYWCGADVGWITGHSYIVYGPLANGTTTTMYEGVPQYPSNDRLWREIDKHNITIFYTAPTVLRALISKGNSWLDATQRSSLRVLGVVGEPTNPEVWRWYHDKVGNSNCPIIDTWWQTETGGVLLSPIPFIPELQIPGSATLPLPGIEPEIMDNTGNAVEGEGHGDLVIKNSWPGQMQTVWGDHQRFYDTYFSQYPGYYCTGDGAGRDSNGYFTLTGRVDDVLNVSGHRLGTAEIESAIVAHQQVAEAAVIGVPDDIKGEKIYAFVTIKVDAVPNDELRNSIIDGVAKHIGKIAKPDTIQFTPGLPKTRSGKIMRRILRKIAKGELDSLGDTSTLADSSVLKGIIENRDCSR